MCSRRFETIRNPSDSGVLFKARSHQISGNEKAVLFMQMNKNHQDAQFEKRDDDGGNQEERENVYAWASIHSQRNDPRAGVGRAVVVE
jgi:hypothetical protein